MAQDKKSFVLYSDLIHVVKKIVIKDRENKTNYAGELFLHILEYVNDLDPIPIDFIVEMAFEPIKQQLKRDLEKYEVRKKRSVENGQKGGRPKKPKKPSGLSQDKKEPKKPDSVSDNVNVSVNGNEKKEIKSSFETFWNLYDKKVDRKKSFEKWEKLKKCERDEIIEKTPDYVKANSDPQFRKNPVTFFNNRSWEDEIIQRTIKSKGADHVHTSQKKTVEDYLNED